MSDISLTLRNMQSKNITNVQNGFNSILLYLKDESAGSLSKRLETLLQCDLLGVLMILLQPESSSIVQV